MRALRASKLTGIFPQEVRTLLKGNSRWIWLLFGAASVVAILEAAALANLLLLGYAVLGQEPTGMMAGLLGERVFAAYSPRVLLVILSSTFIVLIIMRFVLVLGSRYLGYKWSSVVGRKMYNLIMRKIVSAPMGLLDERQLGRVVHDLTNAPQGAIGATAGTADLMSAVFLIGAVAFMLLLISPWLLMFSAAIAFLWFFTIVPPMQRRMQHHQQLRYDALADGTKITTDTINGIREIRALGAEDRWTTEFSHRVDQWEDARGRLVILGSLPISVLQVLLQGSFAVATMLAAFFLSLEDLVTQLPVLGAFAYGLFRAYPLMGQVSQGWINLSQAVPNLRAGAAWTGLAEDPLAGGTQSVVQPITAVRFDHLSFSYDPSEPTIVDANFCIQAGKVTALVGASGAGKSTLIDLMLKFRSPNQGVLWLGDQNLSEIVRRSWLERVGLVRQEVFLFAGTIKENLLEYKPEATDQELRSACRRAEALEFIDAMPYGLDTKMGERGVTLSGGQRQRIAIARALLRNSDYLILDEAMSALDGEAEARILKSLLADAPNRTILLISHRLTTVRHADHIVVLDGGRVVEQGAHEDLLQKRGRYSELFSTQVGLESVDFSYNGRG